MSKIKYQFNHETLSFHKIERKLSKKLYKVILPQVLFSIIIGIAFYSISTLYIDTPAEIKLKEKSRNLQLKFEFLDKELNKTAQVINKLQERDDNLYRMFFQAKPIPASKRKAGFGGSDRYSYLKGLKDDQKIINTSLKLDILSKKMLVQSESYEEIIELVNNKEKMASCIPAIQPIALDELTRFGSAFGMRMHPVFHVYKMHTGVDLTAPRGTKIYATGDGVVFRADGSNRGYGKAIRINHGFGYMTLYAHLSKILVRPGQKVKRGDVIGLVGSTGTSTCAHLHYEVRVNGKWVNPVNFYYDDLSDEEYREMIESSETANTHVFE